MLQREGRRGKGARDFSSRTWKGRQWRRRNQVERRLCRCISGGRHRYFRQHSKTLCSRICIWTLEGALLLIGFEDWHSTFFSYFLLFIVENSLFCEFMLLKVSCFKNGRCNNIFGRKNWNVSSLEPSHTPAMDPYNSEERSGESSRSLRCSRMYESVSLGSHQIAFDHHHLYLLHVYLKANVATWRFSFTTLAGDAL